MKTFTFINNLPASHNLAELAEELRVLSAPIVISFHEELTVRKKGIIDSVPRGFTVTAPDEVSRASIEKIIEKHVPTETEAEAGARVSNVEFAHKIIQALQDPSLAAAIKALKT